MEPVINRDVQRNRELSPRERLEREARRLRAQAVQDALAALFHTIARWMRVLTLKHA